VEQFRGVKLALRYTVTKVPDGTTVMLGRSSHCFLDPEGRPFALKKRFPELDAVLKDLAAAADGIALS
jgi:acyl-CoA thioester hydrolase